MENAAQKRIDVYLDTVRACLRGVKEADVREFVEELRSHVRERAFTAGEMTDGGLEKVLTALGKPEELANEYKANALLAKAEASESPVRILQALLRWASFSMIGLFVLVGAIAGYFFGGVLLLCAGLKPFHPQTAGLWASHDGTGDLVLSFRLGWTNAPAGAHEVLGWWIVPIGFLVAFGLVVTTSRLALWCARRFQSSNLSY